MSDQPAPSRKLLERRTGKDRRQRETVMPTKLERRRSVDARKPEVLELNISNTEWTALTQAPVLPKKAG